MKADEPLPKAWVQGPSIFILGKVSCSLDFLLIIGAFEIALSLAQKLGPNFLGRPYLPCCPHNIASWITQALKLCHHIKAVIYGRAHKIYGKKKSDFDVCGDDV